mmetsp:Transcript_89156/g.207492  ORF Transcript_89156/g.207492 Transcript_89156/m.207492 type:complete len:217 (-) Transcript_89156:505-1155(-)
MQLRGDLLQRLQLVKVQVQAVGLQLGKLASDIALQSSNCLEWVNTRLLYAEAPDDVHRARGAADLAQHGVVVQHALKLHTLDVDGGGVLNNWEGRSILQRRRRPWLPVAVVLKRQCGAPRAFVAVLGQRSVPIGVVLPFCISLAAQGVHLQLLGPDDVCAGAIPDLLHPLLRCEVAVLHNLRQGGQLDLLFTWLTYLFHSLLTDELHALQGIPVGP